MIEIYIPGKAVPQSRPRFARRGNITIAYEASPARDYKSWVKTCAIDTMQKDGLERFDRNTPLSMYMLLTIDKPKSRKKAVFPVTKPDCDNMAKLIMDALEGIAYEADQSIVSLRVMKRYGTAGVYVKINEEKI